MKHLENRVAAITGAAGGIGRAVALELARRGCHVAISDIDADGLAHTSERAARMGVDVHDAIVDVADRQAIYAWADDVADEFGRVHIIINNAGVSVSASVEEMTDEDFAWLMDINFWGVVHGTRAFLPHLRAAGEGHVVNISSIFGVIAVPTQSAYNAAKFAVRGFTEALRGELEFEGAPIGVTTVHPGGVRTNIVRNARFGDTGAVGRSPQELIAEFEHKLAQLEPEEAAEIIVGGIVDDRSRVLVGKDAVFLDLVQRLMPSGYVSRVVDVLRHRYRR